MASFLSDSSPQLHVLSLSFELLQVFADVVDKTFGDCVLAIASVLINADILVSLVAECKCLHDLVFGQLLVRLSLALLFIFSLLLEDAQFGFLRLSVLFRNLESAREADSFF